MHFFFNVVMNSLLKEYLINLIINNCGVSPLLGGLSYLSLVIIMLISI